MARKKAKFNSWGVLTMIIGMVIIAGAAMASNGWFDKIIQVENWYGNIEVPETVNVDSNEVSFGSAAYSENQDDMATSTTDVATHGGINIYDRLRFGDDPNTDSAAITYKFAIKDFTAASNTLFAIQIQESDGGTTNPTVYLEDIGLKFTGIPSSTMQFFVGTSSSQYVNPTAFEAVPDISADSLCSLMDDVLMTDGGMFDATNTTFWAQSDAAGAYAACDVGYSTDFRNVPLHPGDYIVGVASTTAYASGVDSAGAYIYSGDYLDGKVIIRYKFVK